MKNRVPFIVMILVVLVFVIVSWDPPIVLFLMAITYAMSGPAMAVYARKEKLMSRFRTDGTEGNTTVSEEEFFTESGQGVGDAADSESNSEVDIDQKDETRD